MQRGLVLSSVPQPSDSAGPGRPAPRRGPDTARLIRGKPGQAAPVHLSTCRALISKRKEQSRRDGSIIPRLLLPFPAASVPLREKLWFVPWRGPKNSQISKPGKPAAQKIVHPDSMFFRLTEAFINEVTTPIFTVCRERHNTGDGWECGGDSRPAPHRPGLGRLAGFLGSLPALYLDDRGCSAVILMHPLPHQARES